MKDHIPLEEQEKADASALQISYRRSPLSVRDGTVGKGRRQALRCKCASGLCSTEHSTELLEASMKNEGYHSRKILAR